MHDFHIARTVRTEQLLTCELFTAYFTVQLLCTQSAIMLTKESISSAELPILWVGDTVKCIYVIVYVLTFEGNMKLDITKTQDDSVLECKQ